MTQRASFARRIDTIAEHVFIRIAIGQVMVCNSLPSHQVSGKSKMAEINQK